MEESLTRVLTPTQTSQNLPKSVFANTKESKMRTSIKTQGQQDQTHYSQTEVQNQQSVKLFLMHKRRLSNNNTLLGLDPNENASTDNQDQNSKIDRNLFKKIQNSYILKDLEVLYSFFTFDVQFRLLFRASNHHFSTQKFHELCDQETNTLTICKTKSNQIIGGYTPLPWAEDFDQNKTFFKTDKDNETFLFSINKKQKYPLAKAKRNKAICCFKGYGPTFGGGYDLQIGNRADQTYSSVSYFPRSFTCESKIVTQKHLTGSKNKEFKILEWEVYKVTKRTHKREKVKSIENLKSEENQSLSFFDTVKKGLQALLFEVKKKKQQSPIITSN